MAIANPAVVVGLSGKPLGVDLQKAITIADARACVASALACSVMNVRLTLKDTDAANGVLEDSQNLEELPSKVLTAVLVPAILCRGFAQHGGRGGCWNSYTCNDCERILLSPDSKCTLISVTNEDSSSSCVKTQTVTWDVLLGSYKVKDGVAHCSWDMHLHRTFSYGSGSCFDQDEFDKMNFDKSWSFRHSSSSFKWSRIVLSDSPEGRARASLLDRLATGADLLMEDVFAEHIDDSNLRHFTCWHNVDDGVPAQLLKDVCERHRERMQTSPSNESSVAIANDKLPIALVKEAVQWWRLDELAETDALEKLHGDLVGWDVENGFILGVCMTVQLAEVDHTNVWNPPSSVDGKMDELLALMERGDQCQLPALGKPPMTMEQAPSSQLRPVTYTKVSLMAASLPIFCKRSNLNLKVKLISFGKLCMVGDETGVVCMKVHCRTMFHVLEKLKVGASIIIRKATVRLRGLFQHNGVRGECIHVDVDRGVGSIEESRDPFHFEPDEEAECFREAQCVTIKCDCNSDGSGQTALKAGLKGMVRHIDAKGDALIRVEGVTQPGLAWIFQTNFNAKLQKDFNLSARPFPHVNIASPIKPGDACCGDAVQVVGDMMSDSQDPVALTLRMKGVIVEINELGDALIWFAGKETNESVKAHAFPNLAFLEERYVFDESTLKDKWSSDFQIMFSWRRSMEGQCVLTRARSEIETCAGQAGSSMSLDNK